ncbi:hypothetical protein Poly30_17460 [Planctomycetes bacterium Poly30]|uniref:HEAT repeat protein n=1 Tax=Saltatorellus ferox TaxID=2528018 RepID=A0A518EQ81_9BACT|nr:hypothetical protein Poly30_17460 [Planctomycetes bacterium Poly30]
MSTQCLIHSVGLAITAGLLFGCAASGDGAGKSGAAREDGTPVEYLGPTEIEPYDAKLIQDRRSAGLLLAELDKSMRAWNNIVLDGKASQDLTRLDLLESTLRHDVSRHHQLLVDQLQTGPLINRQIAAAALGFSNNPDSLGPLLGALQDPNEDVVANALLGLSTLHSPRTQVGGIASLFADSTKPVNIRSNAGRTLRAIPLGNLDEVSRAQVIDASRLALGDEEASVRVHGSLILAELVDPEAIQRLSLLLTDPSPLVARAASRSIARIGSVDSTLKGRAARALAAFIDKVDRKNVRRALLDDLQRMAQVNYGEDTEAWMEYAHKLP